MNTFKANTYRRKKKFIWKQNKLKINKQKPNISTIYSNTMSLRKASHSGSWYSDNRMCRNQ